MMMNKELTKKINKLRKQLKNKKIDEPLPTLKVIVLNNQLLIK